MPRSNFINDTLARYGYSEDVWLDLRDLNIIVLNRDGNLFIDSLRNRYRFNSELKLLEIAKGIMSQDHTKFTDLTGKTENFTPNEFISYEAIMTIPQSNILLPGGFSGVKPFPNN